MKCTKGRKSQTLRYRFEKSIFGGDVDFAAVALNGDVVLQNTSLASDFDAFVQELLL